MRLHERLREVRRHRGLTLVDVREKTGLSVSYLSDLERGRSNPSFETLERLARAYDMSVLDLLSGVEEAGEATPEGLPPGLAELVKEGRVDIETARDLSRIELRGRRPRTKEDWELLYLNIRRLLIPPDDRTSEP
ncbi:MAG: helix-turn-helix transcriptional regulator [Armatimonadota bacterium]|nr:helix-turn-helix transcriptional regulator [Armatimonadota bacterium]